MKDRLFTPSYYFILAANFLLFFGFWFLMPVLPFYLQEVFRVNESGIGIILASYTVASLCIRPLPATSWQVPSHCSSSSASSTDCRSAW